MAKVRGTGISSVNYPTGMNLGGDPSHLEVLGAGDAVVEFRAGRHVGIEAGIAQIADLMFGLGLEMRFDDIEKRLAGAVGAQCDLHACSPSAAVTASMIPM